MTDIIVSCLCILLFAIFLIMAGITGWRIGKQETIQKLCDKQQYDFCETMRGNDD